MSEPLDDRTFCRSAYERAKADLAGKVRSHPSLLRAFLDLTDAAETLVHFESLARHQNLERPNREARHPPRGGDAG